MQYSTEQQQQQEERKDEKKVSVKPAKISTIDPWQHIKYANVCFI